MMKFKPIIGPPGDVGKVWNLVRGFFFGRDSWSVQPVFSYDPKMCKCVCVCVVCVFVLDPLRA